MAIFCGHRVADRVGAVVAGLGFVLPAVFMVIGLSVLFLANAPPDWIRGAGAGAAAAVPAVALHAAAGLAAPGRDHARKLVRGSAYLAAGAVTAVLAGPYVVLVLLGSGLVELALQRGVASAGVAVLPLSASVGGIGALAWVALKVGALSYGGGFVIIPLMQGDAVHVYHWMSDAQFLNAVALGQVTPGPVTATVAAVGNAAHGIGGALLAAAIAFAPSFTFVLLGGRRFEQLRSNLRARAFLDGAGPAAIGAILGAAVTLAIALSEAWQYALLGGALAALLVLRRGVVATLVTAGVVGTVLALAGGPLP
jgi:chromate transporter